MADVLGIGVIVDALVTGQNRERVFWIIILYVLIHSDISLIRVLFAWLKDAEERKSTNAVQYRYARQALEVDYAYIQTGRFLNLKKKSMKIMPAFYIHIFGDFVSYLLKFLGIFGIFTVVNPWMVFGIILLSVPSVVLSFRRKKAEYQYKQSITGQERRSDYLYQLMTEYAYAKDIRIYGGEGLISRKYMENAEAQMKKKEKLGRGNAGAASIAYLFYALQLLCMLITFSYMVYRKDISIAEYTVLLSSAMLFVSIITGFFENLAEIRELCKYTKLCEEYDTFIANNSKVVNGGAAASEQKGELWEDRPFSIDFEHVSFQYPGREQMVLEDVSFHIGQGEKVSFVGLNGAGNIIVLADIVTILQNLLSAAITIVGLACVIVRINMIFFLFVGITLGIKIILSWMQFRLAAEQRVQEAANDKVGRYLDFVQYSSEGAAKELRVNNAQDWLFGKITAFRNAVKGNR